ncbi:MULTISPECIES: hypothetical protein [unclassified Streptomyces]|uniref:hypothetical protein n=1 Tax=unclassified Streptomyces TaxID=2593676 RepID=UPI002DD88073|nr:hypothetical protein [Streptomyces sp. NBC_01750]WSD33164.1 hypothetical protein OG966_15365 [Streptomyces sp. NBC_01750]
MHPDIHLRLHHLRAAELHERALAHRPQRADIRTQLGWTLVELGLRLVQQPPARAARIA